MLKYNAFSSTENLETTIDHTLNFLALYGLYNINFITSLLCDSIPVSVE